MTEYNTQILPSGDSAILVRFSEQISESINRKVISFRNNLEQINLPGIIETIPAYASLMIIYNPLIVSFKILYREIKEILDKTKDETLSKSRTITIPVCYDSTFSMDLQEVSQQTGLSPAEIIKIHYSSTYRIFMLGFTPGFPYMGETDERIACPRKSTPRQAVPEGSVGLAGRQTGIYPIESPGGWQIIGRTPLKIFNPGSENIFLLRAGDIIQFKPISISEFESISKTQ
ncbi:MAG: 5-oxoprolinase subunit PxpB [Bacteroidales bacterium]|nr:5-oxoprolinase subunit PxpB [Bacteroidales bacterium]